MNVLKVRIIKLWKITKEIQDFLSLFEMFSVCPLMLLLYWYRIVVYMRLPFGFHHDSKWILLQKLKLDEWLSKLLFAEKSSQIQQIVSRFNFIRLG